MKRFNAEMWSLPQASKRSSSDELHDLIIRYIEEGVLIPGERLPSYRSMGEAVNLGKTLIQRIYGRLADKGWVTTKQGAGTYVAANFPNFEVLYPATRSVRLMPIKLRFPLISTIGNDYCNQDFITIGFDTPGPYYLNCMLGYVKSKKYTDIYEKFNKESRIQAIEGVAYKAAILEYLNSKRNFMINADGLEVIVGRNESLQQVFNVMLRAGDVVVNTSPKDKFLCNILNSYAAVEVLNIKLDEYFLKNLKKLLAHTSIKALHVRPQCSHLESNHLESHICNELLQLAKQYGFYIVEEDDYHEFWYESNPFKPLICQNHDGHVIYCGAFSLISTYLQQTRTIVAAEEFISLLKEHPVPINPFRNLTIEMMVIDLLNDNKLWLLIKKMQQDMKENSYGFWMQIDNTISNFVKVKKPSSGLSFWLVCPSDEWLKRSILYLNKKGFHIPYYPCSEKAGAGVQKVQLGFGTWNAFEAEEPLKALFAKYSI